MQLPKLPTLRSSDWKWGGQTGLLAYFIRRFHAKFTPYGDLCSLEFLKTCMPSERYIRQVEACSTLDKALQALSMWCSDSIIHTTHVEHEMHAIPQSNSLADDRRILELQLVKLQHMLDINQHYSMPLANVWPHIAKYADATAYSNIFSNLNHVARNNQDFYGNTNYILPFMLCIREQLKYIDDRISRNDINKLNAGKGANATAI